MTRGWLWSPGFSCLVFTSFSDLSLNHSVHDFSAPPVHIDSTGPEAKAGFQQRNLFGFEALQQWVALKESERILKKYTSWLYIFVCFCSTGFETRPRHLYRLVETLIIALDDVFSKLLQLCLIKSRDHHPSAGSRIKIDQLAFEPTEGGKWDRPASSQSGMENPTKLKWFWSALSPAWYGDLLRF